VNTAVMATEAGSKAVDSSAAQVSEMAAAFREISGLVVTTTDAAREIELSTKQQATAVEQVNLAITTVASATREGAASASQTQQTAGQLTDLSTSLLKIVHAKAG
jgi:methyl-accepting chemotaxis protein